MFTLNMLKAFYRRALSVDILVYLERRYFSVPTCIAIFYKVAIHSCKFFFLFCKLRHGIFCIFFFVFFSFFTKCTV